MHVRFEFIDSRRLHNVNSPGPPYAKGHSSIEEHTY